MGIDQEGNSNVLKITQSGNFNETLSILQKSVSTGTNSLTIKQAGVGTTDNGIGEVAQNNTGATSNIATIDQAGGAFKKGNLVYHLKQTGSGNTATVIQSGQRNVVTTATQIGSNSLDITQNGGNSNWVGTASQDGSGNIATVTQTGTGNHLVTLSQNGTNTANISMIGNTNGALGLTGAAAATGAADSSSVQIGTGNMVGMQISANGNSFGFFQDGADNQAVGITITGNDNQLGVFQDGDRNKLLLATISGTQNNIGLLQDGNDNTASLQILGSGSRNGGHHDFTMSAPASLTSGLMEQLGTNNSVTLTVTGSDNVFGTLQDNKILH